MMLTTRVQVPLGIGISLCAAVLVGTVGCGGGRSSADAGQDLPPGTDTGTDRSAIQTDAAQDDGAGGAADASGDSGPPAQLDPAPDRNTPGFFTVPGGPTTTINMFEMTFDNQTSNDFSGTVTGAVGDGVFYIVKTADVGGAPPTGMSELAGPIPTDGTGEFLFTAPLFCGTQLVKCVWSNAAGRAVLVTRVITTNCVEPDIRVTISWDDLGQDWEAHLVMPGGTINDNATDCTWTSCLGDDLDWGVVGDVSDNPRKDVDNTGPFGPENIFLSKPVTGRFTVLIEHWGAGEPSAGQAIINVRGKATVVDLTNFVTLHVRTIATIDWPAGTVTVINSDYDCTANWSGGCRDKLPM